MRFPFHKLDQEHYDFLISEQTLERQAGLTLKERCKVFEERFSPKKLCPTTLRRIYLKNYITLKSIKELKPIARNKANAYHE